jgi:hypothetical protein
MAQLRNSSMLITTRCLIAATLIGASQLVIWQVQRHDLQGASQAEAFDVSGLPSRLGHWASEEAAMEHDLAQDSGALSTIERTFVNPAGYRLAVVVATFPAAEAILPHPPDLCYTGKGWNVTKDEWQATEDGRRYKLLAGDKGTQKVLVSYWYQLHDKVVSNRDELRSTLQSLRWKGQSWPPMVKVLIHAPVGFSESDALADSEELGGAIYHWILQQSQS